MRSLGRRGRNAKPTSGPTVHHDRSAGGSSDDRPRPAAPLRRVKCAVPPHPPVALPEGPPRRADERAPIHRPAEDHDGLTLHASGAPLRVRNESGAASAYAGIGSVSEANEWTPEVLGAVCGTVLGCACSAANVGRPSDRQHRLHCTSIDPAVRTAAGCGPSQRIRLLARGSGKYLHQPKCSACSRRKNLCAAATSACSASRRSGRRNSHRARVV